MNTLQKTKLRGTGINCGLIVLLFAVVLLLGQVLPDNTYRRVLVPIIWQMCIFVLLGTSLNLTLGYLGQLTLGHMGFAGVGAYTAALTSSARACLRPRKQRPVSSFWSFSAAACSALSSQGCWACSWASRRCGCTVTIWPS